MDSWGADGVSCWQVHHPVKRRGLFSGESCGYKFGISLEVWNFMGLEDTKLVICFCLLGKARGGGFP